MFFKKKGNSLCMYLKIFEVFSGCSFFPNIIKSLRIVGMYYIHHIKIVPSTSSIIKLTMLVFNLPPGRFLVYGFTLIVIRSKRHSEPIFVGLRGLTNWNLNDSLKQEALHEPSNATGCYTRSS